MLETVLVPIDFHYVDKNTMQVNRNHKCLVPNLHDFLFSA